MWIIGALIAVAGTIVYVELGTGLPRSGGDKNYLEYIYRYPKFMMSCTFSVYALIIGSAAAANSVVFGEYVIHTLDMELNSYNTNLVAFMCLTFCLLAHGTAHRFGLRLQNALGLSKFVILCAISVSGLLCLAGVPGFAVREEYEKPQNFEWDKMWEGSGTGMNAFVTGLYSVIWSYIGYAGANYALSEVKNPIRTAKIACPLAIFCVTTVYMLVNIAYFAAVSKDDILGSRRIVVALFFRNLYGPTTEKAVSVIVCFSILGNLLATHFAQGRVLQEIGREGILPCSAFLASNKPFDAPLAALFIQYFVSCACMLAPPAGDVYLFIISLLSYSSAIIHALVSIGLLLLYTPSYRAWGWNPPFRAPKSVIVDLGLTNTFRTGCDFIRIRQQWITANVEFQSHVFVAYAVFLIGVAYWYARFVWLPRRNGYKLERHRVLQTDGVSRFVFEKVPVAQG
ncbi:hypothetical protein H0H92_011740 [Tricholoma furcatifolium]|nr:hypothetical protein H0H92_011740 [Tricholoma furcatifolium]